MDAREHRSSMTTAEFEEWLAAYGRAWESRDPEAAAALFTEDTRYYETPFGEPAVGRDGVRSYWAVATENQRNVHFRYEVFFVGEESGAARWRAEYSLHPEGKRAKLDGVFLLQFNGEGLCRELREWWHWQG